MPYEILGAIIRSRLRQISAFMLNLPPQGLVALTDSARADDEIATI